jgi:hypothetical protein
VGSYYLWRTAGEGFRQHEREVGDISAKDSRFLLVNLSAYLLKWQNPGEVCGDLPQAIAIKWRQLIRRVFGVDGYLAEPLSASVIVAGIRSAQQHAVAITVEAISALHRVTVSR